MPEWDYLIVGAGSAGCALAYDLAKSGKNTVILLEAGGDNRSVHKSKVAAQAVRSCNVTPVYVVLTGELELDAPVEKAWPHIVNYPTWQNYQSIEHISGTPGEEGELVRLRSGDAGVSWPPYYARTIKIEPERRLIWKTHAQSGVGAMDFVGIVDFKLHAENDKTRLCYDTIYEFQMPDQPQRDLEDFRHEQYRNFETLFASVFLRLKTLVQAGN